MPIRIRRERRGGWCQRAGQARKCTPLKQGLVIGMGEESGCQPTRLMTGSQAAVKTLRDGKGRPTDREAMRRQESHHVKRDEHH